jgi:polysaccharide pyruvyl transferase WcaK-like protein
MAYYGSNDDRKSADQIYSSYVTVMKQFVRWLVDNDRKVRLLVGDTNGSDDAVVREILADLRVSRPDLDPTQVTARPVVTFADVMREMQLAASVVAIRFHNVLAALKLGKPTIAIGYSAKHDALMADMGVPEFCEPVSALDADRLIQRFNELESRSARLRELLLERKARNEQLLSEQFAELWAALFPSTDAAISAIVDDSAQKVTR